MSNQVNSILGRRRVLQLRRYGGDGGNEFVFGRRFTSWSDGKADLDSRLNIATWRIHDIRRSAATHMAELGALPHIVEQVLNHQSGSKAGIAGLYNRAKYTDAMREALQVYGDFIDRLNPPD